MALDHVEQTLRRGDGKPEEKIKGKTKQFITVYFVHYFPPLSLLTLFKCEYIPFPSGPVQRVFKPSSPVWFKEKIQLNCTFKGWPRPTVVWINPHGNKIKSGSDGFEIYEELIGDDTLSSVLKNPHMQEKQRGEYWCTAENSIDGWSSKLSKVTELIYECK